MLLKKNASQHRTGIGYVQIDIIQHNARSTLIFRTKTTLKPFVRQFVSTGKHSRIGMIATFVTTKQTSILCYLLYLCLIVVYVMCILYILTALFKVQLQEYIVGEQEHSIAIFLDRLSVVITFLVFIIGS